MKPLRSLFMLVCCAALMGWIGDARAQSAVPPRVLFIDDVALNTASPTDEENEGGSRLAAIFTALGAEVTAAPLSEPLPDAEVIVLVRPRRALAADQLARLWLAIENGANVLLALEPTGQPGITGETADRGIARLLLQDYGLQLRDGYLVTPDFDPAGIDDPDASRIAVRADPRTDTEARALIAPLLDYEIAVTTWGARSLSAEALGIDSYAAPLLYTENAYGEANRDSFRAEDPAPLIVDLDRDAVGRLFVAGVAQNTRRDNRVALLTDGEMLLNGYGLATDANGGALHVGNAILAGRLAAWLLEVSPVAYPPLPSGYLYLQIDGDGGDWTDAAPLQPDAGADFPNARYNLRGVRAFANDTSLYILIETGAPPDPAPQVGLSFDTDADGTPDRFVTVDGARVFLQSAAAVGILAEARTGFGSVIEIQLPRAFIGTAFELCISAPDGALSGAAASAIPDCAAGVRAVIVPERDLPRAP